jgi:hypothetical protein
MPSRGADESTLFIQTATGTGDWFDWGFIETATLATPPSSSACFLADDALWVTMELLQLLR